MRIQNERNFVFQIDYQHAKRQNESRENASNHWLKNARIDERSSVLHKIREHLSTIHWELFKQDKIIYSIDAKRTINHEKRKKKKSI